MDAVERELARVGVSEYRLNVIAANEDAIRLYRRRGMVHVTTVLLGRVRGDDQHTLAGRDAAVGPVSQACVSAFARAARALATAPRRP